MRKLIIGTGLSLVAISGTVAAAPDKPTPAGAVAVTEAKCPTSAPNDKIKLTDAAPTDKQMQQDQFKMKLNQPMAKSGYKIDIKDETKIDSTAKSDSKTESGFLKIDSAQRGKSTSNAAIDCHIK